MQIGKKVHALKIPFSLTTPSGITVERFVYVYLIYGSEICLIDTGVSSSEEVIFDYVRKTDRKVSDIALIIQTHTHPDHMGATKAIKAETGCAVAVHAAEKEWIENVELQFKERPVPGFHSLVAGSVAVNRVLEDGDVVDLGCGMELQVVHTPGHSAGSISLLLLGYNELFSGDAVPVPGAMPVYEDVPASVNSLKKLKGIPGIHHLLSSWDEPKKGAEAYHLLEDGLRYIQHIHEAVIKISANDSAPEPMGLCARVLEELGIPPSSANPIVERSLAAHLPWRGQQIII